MPAAEAQAMWDEFAKTLEDAEFRRRKSYKPNKADWLEGHWAGFQPPNGRRCEHIEQATAVPNRTLQQDRRRAGPRAGRLRR